MAGLPHEALTAQALAPLITPGPYLRRVCLVHTPRHTDRAPDLTTGAASTASGRRPKPWHAIVDDAMAERAGEIRMIESGGEETAAAVDTTWTLYVTVTVKDPRLLEDAVADLELRARTARLRLRRCRGWQHWGFAASLGAGINPLPAPTRRGWR